MKIILWHFLNFYDPVYYVKYKTTYNNLFKLPLYPSRYKYYNHKSPIGFLIEDIKLADIPYLPMKSFTWSDLFSHIHKKYKPNSFPENDPKKIWCTLAHLPQHILESIFCYSS
jgi:hypothetical protein